MYRNTLFLFFYPIAKDFKTNRIDNVIILLYVLTVNLENKLNLILNEYHYGYPMDRLLEASLKNKYCVYDCAISQNGEDLSDIGGHQSFGKKGFIDSFDKLDK